MPQHATGTPPASQTAPSANAWAVVNGHEITRDDVEKAYRRAAPAGQQPSEEEAYTAKLNLLNELIVQDLLLAKAKELKIELPETELDTRLHRSEEEHSRRRRSSEELKSRNLSAADMREDLRRNLLAQKVVEKEVGEKVDATDADITAFFEANKAQFNRTEDAVHIAQIVITPVREQQRTNRTGDDAGHAAGSDGEGADADAELEGRHRVRRPRRGLSRKTANRRSVAAISDSCRCRRCAQAPPALRDAVFKSNPGTVQLVSQGGAHTIVLDRRQGQEGPEGSEHAGVKEGDQLDAQGPQGAVAPRRLSHRASQRRDGRERAGEAGDRRRRARCRRCAPAAPARSRKGLEV